MHSDFRVHPDEFCRVPGRYVLLDWQVIFLAVKSLEQTQASITTARKLCFMPDSDPHMIMTTLSDAFRYVPLIASGFN